MYCNKCGSELPDHSAFCMSCGAKLKDLNQEKPVEEQKSTVESVQEPVEKEIEQNIPPITQMQSDVMTAGHASAELVKLGQVLEQAVDIKHVEKHTLWARIRVDKDGRVRLKNWITSCNIGVIFLIGFALALFVLSKKMVELIDIDRIDLYMMIFAGWCFVGAFVYTIMLGLSQRLLKETDASDLYVSNVRCYGIDIHGKTVSFLLNDIVEIKRVKHFAHTKQIIDCGFLSLCTVGGEYIFASRDIDIVFTTFSKYLSEREKNR